MAREWYTSENDKWTQKEIAEALGVSESTVRNWVNISNRNTADVNNSKRTKLSRDETNQMRFKASLAN